MKKKQIIGIVVAGIVFVAVCLSGVVSNVVSQKIASTQKESNEKVIDEMMSSISGSTDKITLPSEDFVGIVNVVGTIQGSESVSLTTTNQYNHTLNMNYVDQMEKASNNKGILLYVDSPGGTVYHADELYLKLMEYKEKTKRPVYAYFASEACSGGYYVSMAADKIFANRNCWTGSIGVIVSLTNYKKLYDKLGVKEIDITSGKNKAMGSAGLDLTEEQRDILQELVDEAYEQFTDIVSNGRSMDIDQVKKLADGRIYTAKQAKDNGLIDEVGSLEDEKLAFKKEARLASDITFFEPKNKAVNFLQGLLGTAMQFKNKTQSDLITDIMQNKGNGVLMYYAD